VTAVTFTLDGKCLATGLADGTVRFRRAAADSEVAIANQLEDYPRLQHDKEAQVRQLQDHLNVPRQDQCATGFRYRDAVPGDRVCVTQLVFDQVLEDNKHASERSAGSGPYGADTCRQGYVWREATPGDHVCVEPSVRRQAALDNRQAQYRLATGSK
jgi:hypothetical protein